MAWHDDEVLRCKDCTWEGYSYEAKKYKSFFTKRGSFYEHDLEAEYRCPRCGSLDLQNLRRRLVEV